MVVIGGGAAGLTASGISASLGAKTALIEAQRLGGDCTWYGCVPSKTLLKAAKVAHSASVANRYGLRAFRPEFDFNELMRHVHAVQSHIYEDADAPPVFEKLGVEVIEGRAHFFDAHSLDVTGPRQASRRIRSRYFVLATASAPRIPPIEGIGRIPYLTNETLFSLDRVCAQAVANTGALAPADIRVSRPTAGYVRSGADRLGLALVQANKCSRADSSVCGTGS